MKTKPKKCHLRNDPSRDHDTSEVTDKENSSGDRIREGENQLPATGRNQLSRNVRALCKTNLEFPRSVEENSWNKYVMGVINCDKHHQQTTQRKSSDKRHRHSKTSKIVFN